MDKVGAQTATYTAAVLSLIFAFLPEFKKFKGLGIEAELLDKKIEETEELLAQLRNITSPIAEMLISTTARSGRLGSAMPRHQKYELLQKIEGELRNCGVSDSQLEKAKADWHYYNIFDMSSPIFVKIQAKLNKIRQEREKLLSEFKQPITPETKEEHEKLVELRNEAVKEIDGLRDLRQLKKQEDLPELINESISSSNLLSTDQKNELHNAIREELRDLEHYVKYHEFRRLSVWLAGDRKK